ncbi:MAG: hypothetical protein AB7F66_00780 [Bacteriovoracia bacterium]
MQTAAMPNLIPTPSQPRPLSVQGRILARLTQGPATVEQVIEYVWGNVAPGGRHPSYVNRLHVNVHFLRKRRGFPIQFDGEKFHLPV